ncbi:MAG TPA: hypothetical protein VJL29_05845 [Thermoguttaceae bacterium]|nr:hypothetical protein [Thermoguttaceae bacterium]
MRGCLVLSVVVLVVTCCPALGSSILGDLMTLDGNADALNDNSRGMIFDNDQDNVLSAGDEYVGVLQLERVNDADPSPSGLYAIFSFRMNGSRSLDGVPIQDHEAIPSSETHGLKSLLDDGLEPGSFTDWDNAVFAFVEIPSLGINDPKDPFSLMNSDSSDDPLSIISNVMTAANGYSLDAIVGFGNENDFISTAFNTLAGRQIGNKDGVLTIPEILADNSGTTVFLEKAGLSVLYHEGGMSFLQMSAENYGNAATLHDIIMSPDGAIQTSTASVPNWHLEDDTNFLINPVPEPTTMTMLLSLAALLGMVPWRQRS